VLTRFNLGSACLAHLREAAPLLTLEKALFRARGTLLAACHEQDRFRQEQNEDAPPQRVDDQRPRLDSLGGGYVQVRDVDDALDSLMSLALPSSASTFRPGASRRRGRIAAERCGKGGLGCPHHHLEVMRSIIGEDCLDLHDDLSSWETTLRGAEGGMSDSVGWGGGPSLEQVARKDSLYTHQTHDILNLVEQLLVLMPGNVRSKPQVCHLLTGLIRVCARMHQHMLQAPLLPSLSFQPATKTPWLD